MTERRGPVRESRWKTRAHLPCDVFQRVFFVHRLEYEQGDLTVYQTLFAKRQAGQPPIPLTREDLYPGRPATVLGSLPTATICLSLGAWHLTDSQ